MLNLNELLPVLLIGCLCGIISSIDSYKEDRKEREIKISFSLLIAFRNFIYSLLFSCSIFWLSGRFIDDYELKLGLVSIVGILGIEKAIEVLEKINILKVLKK